MGWRLPGEQYSGDELRHIHIAWAKMEAGREHHDQLKLLRDYGYRQ